MMLHVDLPYACYGLVFNDNNICIRAPPIARWMIGKQFTEIEQWLNQKHAKLEITLLKTME